MEAGKVIREIMKDSGVRQAGLAELLGYNQKTVSRATLAKGIQADTLVKYAEALGYEVVVRKKAGGAQGKEYVLTQEEEKPDGLNTRERTQKAFEEVYGRWKKKELTATEAANELGIKKNTFYIKARRYEGRG